MKATHVIKIYDGLNWVMTVTTTGEIGENGVDATLEYIDDLELGHVAEELGMISQLLEARHMVHKMRDEFGAEEFADQNDLEDLPF